jgi:glutamyl-tRNA synthetase
MQSWLGLDWHDEGPFYQMQRFARYKESSEQMLREGTAYYCYAPRRNWTRCAPRSGAQARSRATTAAGAIRQGCCPTAGRVPPVVRFKNPIAVDVVGWDDLSRADHVRNDELDDLIIARADGTPTYNFCVVVDDWDMGITHVIRGDDHVNNTPRQINILRALGAEPPAYAHVPMILGPMAPSCPSATARERDAVPRRWASCRKRCSTTSVRLGWSHGDQELFTREEMSTTNT